MKATMSSALEDLMVSIRKKHGEQALTKLTGRTVERVPVIPTGSLALDHAMGIGGYPRGRIIEIYGPEASGKTTLTLHALANVQADMGTAAFIDAEHALDLKYAQNVGVNTDDLLFSQPDHGEMALGIVEDLVESGSLDLIVVDSVAALVPKAELDGEVGDFHVGTQARMMSQALRKFAGIISRNMTTVIFINQLRSKIGVMFGSPEVTTGGNALKFYASVRLDIRRRALIQGGDDPIGNHGRVKVVKNKFAPPFREAEIDIIWGRGVDQMGDLISAGIMTEVLDKRGAWISYGDERLGQGFNKAANVLLKNDSLRSEIYGKVRQAILPDEVDE